jgi:3',5'-cyclic AMP phosphodiesterase CpdA
MTDQPQLSRRGVMKCLAFGGAGTLFTLSGGVLMPSALGQTLSQTGTPLFLQISDTHIGFNKDANPDVAGTLKETIAKVNAMTEKPLLTIHTGDITHLSKAAEFDLASQLLSDLKAGDLHTVPGEHDVTDGPGAEYFGRFGKASGNRGYYSFDHQGVHFIALINVMNFKPNGLGAFGTDQLAWLKDDLASRSSSTPIVVFAHMPMWTIEESWGWGTGDAPEALSYLRRFGSVTVLNGHIHQIVQKVEGNVTFHTARSTAYPQPQPGIGDGPGPLKVPADQLPHMLGLTSITVKRHHLSLSDSTLA